MTSVTPFGQSTAIRLFGSHGALHYDLTADRLYGASKQGSRPGSELAEIPIPPEKARSWQVEQEFVRSIRDGESVRFTDFATGVAYMEFTEAVARSAELGEAITLPLEEFIGAVPE